MNTNQIPPGKHRYFPGNYSNKCAVCGLQFEGTDKLCFVCSDCIDKYEKLISEDYGDSGSLTNYLVQEIKRLRKLRTPSPIEEHSVTGEENEGEQMEEYKHGYREGWNDCMIHYKIKPNHWVKATPDNLPNKVVMGKYIKKGRLVEMVLDSKTIGYLLSFPDIFKEVEFLAPYTPKPQWEGEEGRNFDIDVLLGWIAHRIELDELNEEMNNLVREHRFEEASTIRGKRNDVAETLGKLRITVGELLDKYQYYFKQLTIKA